MTQHILVTAIGSDRAGLVRHVTTTLLDCGCNIVESRLATMGSQFVMLIMVSGNWHSHSKLNSALDVVAKAQDLQIQLLDTNPVPARANQIPYAIDLVCLDQAGIVNTLASFLATHNIAITEMTSKRYAAAHTGAQMFNLQMIISLPDNTHIASLREAFMELCDHFNFDAILEPVKN
ncbi:MAG: glycine cleavage system protein R [Gammaproteobacteria bacterium]